MRIILSALVLVACGTTGNMAEPVVRRKPTVPQDAGIDPLLLEAVQVWKEDCRQYSAGAFDCGALLRRVDSIRVSDKLDRGTLGTCRLWETAFIITWREITIAPDVVRRPVLLRAVLAHEMGHCALLLNHVTSDDSHLMSPYLLTDTRVLEARLPAMLQRFYAEAQAKLIPRIE